PEREADDQAVDNPRQEAAAHGAQHQRAGVRELDLRAGHDDPRLTGHHLAAPEAARLLSGESTGLPVRLLAVLLLPVRLLAVLLWAVGLPVRLLAGHTRLLETTGLGVLLARVLLAGVLLRESARLRPGVLTLAGLRLAVGLLAVGVLVVRVGHAGLPLVATIARESTSHDKRR